MSAARAALLALLWATALPGVVRDPVVRAELPWIDRHGYSPVTVSVDSLSPRSLVLEAAIGGTTARATVAVPAGSSRHHLLLPPHAGEHTPWASLRWRSDDDREGELEGLRSIAGPDIVLLLLDPGRALEEAVIEQGVDAWSSRGGYSYAATRHARIDPELLPDRWQAYAEDRVVLLHRSAVERLDPAQRRALDRFARSGGLVTIAGGDPAALAIPAADRLDGTLERWLVEVGQERERRARFEPRPVPVPGTEEVPVGAFALLAVGFALVVGPLNLWWALRRRQRWLLLVSTPALSAVTCLVLVAVNLVSDGVTTRRLGDQLVLLDARRHEAVVWSGVTAFAPFAGTRLALDSAVEVTHLDPGARDGHGYRRRGEGRQLRGLGIAWDQGQLLTGSWLPPRINRRLLYTQPRALRQRLLLRLDGDQPVLTNGLEVAIDELVWRDAGGRWWQGSDLAPGAEQPLQQLPIRGRPTIEDELPVELGTAAALAWRRAAEAGQVRARLAAPALPLPGFEGRDVQPPQGFLCGPLVPEGSP